MKTEFDIEMENGKILHLTENQLIDIIAQAVKKALWREENNRLIIFSYDATQEFKDHYEETYDHEFSQDELWAEIRNLQLIDIQGKPVESTLVIEAEDSSCYREVVKLIEEKFDGLPYVIGVVEQKDGEDLYDVNPNPDSEDDNF